MSQQLTKKELLFCAGALRAVGLSAEHAAVVAERVMAPGAQLSESDAWYKNHIVKSISLLDAGLSRRWS